MSLHELALLRAVRAGAESASEAAAATGLSISTVILLAQGLVRCELLCALDGEPWAIRAEAMLLVTPAGEGP